MIDFLTSRDLPFTYPYTRINLKWARSNILISQKVALATKNKCWTVFILDFKLEEH